MNIDYFFTFLGIDSQPWICQKILEREDQLLCPELQVQVGGKYNELKNSFKQFQRKLRQVIAEAKRKGGSIVHQLRIHNLFKKWTLKSLAINF